MEYYWKFKKAPVTFSMFMIIICIYVLDHTVFNGILVEFGSGKSFSRMEVKEWYRFITNVFFHDGLLHLGANCIALHVVGNILETKVKSYWFLIVFYCGHLIANIILAGLVNYRCNIGASAGIFSLIAWVVVLYLQNSEAVELNFKSISGIYLIGYAILSNFYGWFTAAIHSIGFAWGIVITLFLAISKRIPFERTFIKSNTIN